MIEPVDVVVVGDLNPDLILAGGDVVPRFGQAEKLVERADLTLGGSAGICAAGLARLGLRVALVAAVADDELGRLVTRQLAEHGVRTDRLVPLEGSTGVSVHLVEGDDRAILTHGGVTGYLAPDQLEGGHLQGARHVHLASVFLTPALTAGLAPLLGAVKQTGATVSIDTNWDPAERWNGAVGLRELLLLADDLLPNEAEALALTTADDLDEAARRLAARGAEVMVKRGPAGAARWTGDGWLVQRPVVGHAALGDAIGAGDSADAGYLAARLRGLEPLECLRWAVAAGTLSTRGRGGTSAQATELELLDAIERLPAAEFVSDVAPP